MDRCLKMGNREGPGPWEWTVMIHTDKMATAGLAGGGTVAAEPEPYVHDVKNVKNATANVESKSLKGECDLRAQKPVTTR